MTHQRLLHARERRGIAQAQGPEALAQPIDAHHALVSVAVLHERDPTTLGPGSGRLVRDVVSHDPTSITCTSSHLRREGGA